MPVQLSRDLKRRLQRYFTAQSIDRGEAYFYNRKISGLQIAQDSASAKVQGTDLYSVSLAWPSGLNGQIQAHCNCPQFQKGNYCKHLWALILELEDPDAKIAENEDRIGPKPAAAVGTWRQVFSPTAVKEKSQSPQRDPQVFAVLEPGDVDDGSVGFRFYSVQIDKNGSLSTPRPIMVPQSGEVRQGGEKFRSTIKAITTLARGEIASETGYASYRFYHDPSIRFLRLESLRLLLPELFETMAVFANKADFVKSHRASSSLRFRAMKFGQMSLRVTDCEDGHLLKGYIETQLANGSHVADSEFVPIQDLKLFSGNNLFRYGRGLGFVDLSEAENSWFSELRMGGLLVPFVDQEAFLETLLNQNFKVELPESLRWPRGTTVPTFKLGLHSDRETGLDRYQMDLRFTYGARTVSFWEPLRDLPSAEDRHIFVRNSPVEDALFAKLPSQLLTQRREGEIPTVHAQKLTEFVKAALAAGIPVEIESKKINEASDFAVSVSSGVDWFEVDGQAGFSGRWVKYPTILEAMRRGEQFVPLPDGSLGLISEQMTKRLEKLASFAEVGTDHLKFTNAQGILLNSLLENETGLKLDAKFKSLRQKIKSFSGIAAVSPVKSFQGKLRKYQREGLGWLEFLNDFGLGGILADDMGLGKTIQCLAFLEGRRMRKGYQGPSLLVAPKSLLENWRAEAAKFTPDLKVLIHAGLARDKSAFQESDLIVTTYQTMLRDVESLREIEWDCVIADEAQAIKNPEALVSKAIKLLSARFRLGMTGTPIENSVQDLFSISNFVNPGFLHGKKRGVHLKISDEAREALAKAFKSVVLRRTKDQVLKDLPEKTEQLIFVDLEPKQLKVYNELKKFYQSQLLKQVEEKGINKSQIQILAALTRLRQVALHPGLIDPNQAKARSSKFEVVLEMLEELIAEGHRVLIFSQFTSLLALFKIELEARDIEFSYLDGKTLKRHDVVNEFKDSKRSVFLMSLKAGGVGLNLVEANYVFLLDPWWNPAVEAQAIDRVHRIGQKRAVNAYRFIAKNTVEEKILELQNTKRGLAQEILGEKSGVRGLTAQDIENLFS